MQNSYLTNNKISASQLSTWIKSPNEYIKQYLEGKPFIGNKYTRFGSLIHKHIEENDETVAHIPKLEKKEHYFERPYKQTILNGYLDSYEVGSILDYKVSKAGKWSQKDVDKNVQLKFYGFWHYQEHNELPKVSLVHIESNEDNYGDLYLTGSVIKYDKAITEEDVKFIEQKIEEFIIWCEDYKLKCR